MRRTCVDATTGRGSRRGVSSTIVDQGGAADARLRVLALIGLAVLPLLVGLPIVTFAFAGLARLKR